MLDLGKRVLVIPKLSYFILLIFLVTICVFLQQKYIFVEQLKDIDIPLNIKHQILTNLVKYGWATYIVSYLIILVRCTFVATCLFVGTMFFDKYSDLNYVKVFNISLKSDFILVIYSILSIILSMSNVISADGFICKTSLLAFISHDTAPHWFTPILASFNIFELLYWLCLAWLTSKITNHDFLFSLSYIISTYGIGFILYILILLFLVLYLA